MTIDELKARQSWTLYQKIDHTVGAVSDYRFMGYENNGVTYREALPYIGTELPDDLL